jgi:hypothetical protein
MREVPGNVEERESDQLPVKLILEIKKAWIKSEQHIQGITYTVG